MIPRYFIRCPPCRSPAQKLPKDQRPLGALRTPKRPPSVRSADAPGTKPTPATLKVLSVGHGRPSRPSRHRPPSVTDRQRQPTESAFLHARECLEQECSFAVADALR